MNKIEFKVLNPMALNDAEDMLVCAARLTQRGHGIKSMKDFTELLEKEYAPSTFSALVDLPHPTIQKFAVINVAVVGASRRFLAQITRHQNEVKFMSASLQYSDYSDDSDFVVPYELLDSPLKADYLAQCRASMEKYKAFVKAGTNNDTAGYMAPQSLRNALIISATPYQWKHMIGQRICRRNTDETRYVMLRIWQELYSVAPILFNAKTTGPYCVRDYCREGKMSCGDSLPKHFEPSGFLRLDFPKLYED